MHKLLLHPASGRLWQQNHCGVYRSDDRGETWERLDGNGLPSAFGFPIALDPADPDVAYVVPEGAARTAVTSDGRLGVYRTTDGGASWELYSEGLPEHACASSCARDGVRRTRPGARHTGRLGLVARGRRWHEVARDLPPILSVELGDERWVRLPSILAQEAGGQRRFEIDAATVGEALPRAADRGSDLRRASGALRPLVNVSSTARTRATPRSAARSTARRSASSRPSPAAEPSGRGRTLRLCTITAPSGAGSPSSSASSR